MPSGDFVAIAGIAVEVVHGMDPVQRPVRNDRDIELFDVTRDRIKHIWAVRNPEKLRPWTTG